MSSSKNRVYYILLFSILTLSLFFNAHTSLGASEPSPQGIRVTVVNDPTNSIVVSWYTTEKATNHRVSYSLQSSFSDLQTVSGIERISDATYIYSAEITGLEPDTKYYYKVMAEDYIYEFTTAEERSAKNVEFLVLGDTQTVEIPTFKLTQQIMDKYGNEIDFVIHMGDVVDNGVQQGDYNEYFYGMEHVHAYKQCYFTEGNHEGGMQTKMYDNIPLPSNGISSLYYSFSWGPASFVSLNDNDAEYFPHQKMPLTWLESELARFDLYKYSVWKFAYMHQPIFNAKESRTDKYELIPTWVPTFESHDVDIVFLGHNHYYQRTYPLNHLYQYNDSATTNFENPEYPMYITCNTDKKLYDVGDDLPDYVLYHNKTIQVSYIEIDINTATKKTTLSLESWALSVDHSGSSYTIDADSTMIIIDSFTITKDLPDKYTNVNYNNPTTAPSQRMPEFIYFILYFAILAVFIVFFNRKALKNYVDYKRPKIREIFTDETDETKPNRQQLIYSSALFGIFIVLSVVFYYVMIEIDIVDEEISIAIAILLGILTMIPVNYLISGKFGALNTLAHAGLYLWLAFIVVVILLGYNYLFYIIYLDLLFVAAAVGLSYGANKLSKNITTSKISGRESFYLGGSMIFFSIVLAFFGFAILVAQI